MDYRTKIELYEKKKQELRLLNLSSKDYETQLKAFCKKIKL